MSSAYGCMIALVLASLQQVVMVEEPVSHNVFR